MQLQQYTIRPAITVQLETSLEECWKLMEKHQIRRIRVVDQKGAHCGIVAQEEKRVLDYEPADFGKELY